MASGVCVFFIPLVRDKWQNLGVSCLFGAVSTVGWNALDVLSTELFPTNVRYGNIKVRRDLSSIIFFFFYLHNMKISIDSIIIFSCYIYDTFFIQILSVQLKIYTITLSINIQMHFACNFMENSK